MEDVFTRFIYIEDLSLTAKVIKRFPDIEKLISKDFTEENTLIFVNDKYPNLEIDEKGMVSINTEGFIKLAPNLFKFLSEVSKDKSIKIAAKMLVNSLS